MIQITDKKKCSGCEACYNVCPQKAIYMKQDEEGFFYPEINMKRCIQCGLCNKICPNLKKMQTTNYTSKAFAAYYKTDNEIRYNSTSGGVFSAIAEEIIRKKGVVFGAAFNEYFEVEHLCIENIQELHKFRGSKYVQSRINNTYKKILEFLQQERYVLFSGTPCQISGLKAFLKKDYEKLYCVEVFCKGVPTPKLWKKYIENKQKEKNKDILEIRFREKTYGFHSTTMLIKYKNGKKYAKGHESDPMLRLFVQEMVSRPSCYECNYRGRERLADFSIGDLWHAGNIVKKYKTQEDKGITLLLINSKKAENMLAKLKNIEIEQIDFEKALVQNANGKISALITNPTPNDRRKYFFEDLSKKTYDEVINKYCPITPKVRLKAFLKPILYKTKVLELMKKITK